MRIVCLLIGAQSSTNFLSHACRRSRETLSRFGRKQEIREYTASIRLRHNVVDLVERQREGQLSRHRKRWHLADDSRLFPGRKKERKQAEGERSKRPSRDSRHFPMLLSCPPRVYRPSSVVGDSTAFEREELQRSAKIFFGAEIICFPAMLVRWLSAKRRRKKGERKRESRHAGPEIRSMTPRET